MLKYFFKDIGLTVWASLPFGIIFAIAIMTLIPIIKGSGFKSFISDFFKKLKDRQNRYQLYFWIYAFTLFNRTVLSREQRYKPLINIFGGWKIIIRGYTGLDAQVVGNIMIFIPFTFLMLLAFEELRKTPLKTLVNGIGLSILMSVAIELCQTLFLKGTLQIADLVLNFGGALIGTILFIIINYINNIIIKRKK